MHLLKRCNVSFSHKVCVVEGQHGKMVIVLCSPKLSQLKKNMAS